MKKLYFIAVAISVCAATASAQSVYEGSDPVGKVSYSLPKTTLTFEVEAVQEKFYAGPYAKYAAKYLGIDVKQKDGMTCQLTGVKMNVCTEADPQKRFILDASNGALNSLLLELTSQGLVSVGSSGEIPDRAWKFPVAADGDFSDKGVNSNLMTQAATLYQSGKKSKVTVQQAMVVEKSPEKRAEEAAAMIFRLREQRMAIVTGDTDATYSGEAMGAAIQEMKNLEEEYMTLFTGYSETQTQKMTFDLVPEKDRDSQLYVAFRISETAGIVQADNISGRPVILEITPAEVMQPSVEKKTGKVSSAVVYRIPAVCTVKLTDGTATLMNARVPIYQLGIESTLPATK